MFYTNDENTNRVFLEGLSNDYVIARFTVIVSVAEHWIELLMRLV